MTRKATRNVIRRPQIAEDAARLKALQRGILECQIAIDRSRAAIQSTIADIRFLDRLQDHLRDAAEELERSAPILVASRTNASE